MPVRIPIKWSTVSEKERVVYTRWSSDYNGYVLGLTSDKLRTVPYLSDPIVPIILRFDYPVLYSNITECFDVLFTNGLKPMKGHRLFVTFTRDLGSVSILLTLNVMLSNQFDAIEGNTTEFNLPNMYLVEKVEPILSRYQRKWVI